MADSSLHLLSNGGFIHHSSPSPLFPSLPRSRTLQFPVLSNSRISFVLPSKLPPRNPSIPPLSPPLPPPPPHNDHHSEFQEKMLFLDSIGIDFLSVIKDHPPVASASLPDIRSAVDFMTSMNFTALEFRRIVGMCPEILTSRASDLIPIFTFLLREARVDGADIKRVINRRPRLLACSVKDRLRPTLYFLQSIGISEVHKHTSLLSCSVEEKLIPRIEFFENLGFSRRDALIMFRRFPQLFCYSIKENLEPKLNYFVVEMGRELKELKEFPHYFSFSLENRIKPRHQSCVEKGVCFPLPELLKTSEMKFREKLEANQTAKRSVEHDLIQLELGLVDIFMSLCRFEWQAGYQELATALFQAEIEFSLFCPALHLNDRSKQRLFEHFWNTDAERVGEEGALGWSTWLEKEEENRQKAMREEALEADEKGGWTGWSDPPPKEKKNSDGTETTAEMGVVAEETMEEYVEEEDIEKEDSTEALLKVLGINADAGVDEEVKDASTWARWSKEESLRDCEQWMPIRAKTDVIHDEGMPDGETNEQFLRVILYEDVKEYLFSLISSEARLSLIYQLIEFFSGKIYSRASSNSSSWMERILSLEVLPEDILHHLRSVHDILNKRQSSSSSSTLEVLVGGSDNLSQMSDMMKFLRNTILLCLTAFPRNYILEEAALIAEELFVTKMNSCDSSVTPCRSLAKNLLKSDRQDMLLCGVYARREATYGNIDHARKVFDMALASVESLPVDQKSNAPLLYFWYAELELANDHHNGHNSLNRAVHILSCLGSGTAYSPFKCQPSSLQLLRAHQGFKEKIREVRSTWLHGVIDDSSVALISSAALFEELTTGYNAGLEVLDQAFSMVLPERRKQSYQLEYLFNYYVKMLLRHHKQLSQLKVRESISHGLQFYPLNPELYSAFLEISYIYLVPSKLRWTFDDYCQKQPSLILWIFALSFEMGYGGSLHRIRRLFEKALENENLRHSVLLWRCYISYELNTACDPSSARRVFFRAIHSCPWSKKLWLDGFLKLNSVLSAKELSDLQEVMRDKELNLRTDIYEILLQDELVS